MMKKRFIWCFSLFLLTGCQSLNFQTEPKIEPDCQYETLSGTEFRLSPLSGDGLINGYKNIYVAQSKSSATLSAQYQGMKGKLTDNIIERNYPQAYLWQRSISPFRHPRFYDNDDYFYLTNKQREEREQKTKSVFQQAILQNCAIVYISIFPVIQPINNTTAIEAAGLKIINK